MLEKQTVTDCHGHTHYVFNISAKKNKSSAFCLSGKVFGHIRQKRLFSPTVSDAMPAIRTILQFLRI
jgi:hypothetical protein